MPTKHLGWKEYRIIDREPVRFSRWIKQAVHIGKEGQHAMNRDEGSYQLSHAYDGTTAFLTRHRSVVSRTGRTEYRLLLMKASN